MEHCLPVSYGHLRCIVDGKQRIVMTGGNKRRREQRVKDFPCVVDIAPLFIEMLNKTTAFGEEIDPCLSVPSVSELPRPSSVQDMKEFKVEMSCIRYRPLQSSMKLLQNGNTGAQDANPKSDYQSVEETDTSGRG